MTPLLPVRVMVTDAWDEVPLQLPVTATLGDLKRQALEATRVTRDPAGYLVKYRGAEVPDQQSLAEAGVVPNAGLIVLARRRRPVR
jgi:hypothetical protein